MFCQKCGAELREGARFCTKCGSKFEPPIVPENPKAAEGKSEPAPVPEPMPAPESVSAPDPVPAFEPAPDLEFEPAPAPEPMPAPEPVSASDPISAFEPASDFEPEPAPASEPMPEPMPEPVPIPHVPMPKPRKSPRKGSKGLSVLFCLLFAVAALLASASAIVRSSLTENGIANMLERVELDEIELINAANGEKLSVAEYLYRTGDDEAIETYEITQENVEAIVEKLEWKDGAAQILAEYADCFLNGSSFSIDASDIADILRDNAKLFKKEANGFEFDDEKLEERIENDLLEKIDPAEMGVTSTLLSIGLSNITLIVLIALAFVFALLALICGGFHARAWLARLGTATLVLGGLLLVGAAVAAVLSIVLGNALFSAAVMPNLILLLLFGAGFFIVGMLMVILSKVIGSKG